MLVYCVIKNQSDMTKTAKTIIAPYLILLMLLVSSNCEDDNVDSNYEEVILEEGCNLNLPQVGTFTNLNGIIRSTGDQISPFVIKVSTEVTQGGSLLPCNPMSTGIGNDGTEIRFSGHLYEELPHDTYGVPFELTRVEVKIE